MKIKTGIYPVAISKRFISILEQEIAQSSVDLSSGVITNFRDHDYGAETGGYHPVEIGISEKGVIRYITDFSFVGQQPFAELAKELDFDFENQVFQQMGRDYPIKQGKGLFRTWQSNFCTYHESGVYQVSVSPI